MLDWSAVYVQYIARTVQPVASDSAAGSEGEAALNHVAIVRQVLVSRTKLLKVAMLVRDE